MLFYRDIPVILTRRIIFSSAGRDGKASLVEDSIKNSFLKVLSTYSLVSGPRRGGYGDDELIPEPEGPGVFFPYGAFDPAVEQNPARRNQTVAADSDDSRRALV